MNQKQRIDILVQTHNLSNVELVKLFKERSIEMDSYLFHCARSQKEQIFGNTIYLRGLIEFSSYCTKDCLYCGLRKSNSHAERYHLTEQQILSCINHGYSLGYRTFVLQSGEDRSYSDEQICNIVQTIKARYPDSAVTLSIGEKTYEQYRMYRESGCDRYLLRHETANSDLYQKLHSKEQSLFSRMDCLQSLKTLGYQTGAGMMIQPPFQTFENLIEDIRYMQKWNPEMIGIGPFIAQKDTPFADYPNGTVDLTVFMIAVLRLFFPKALIPSTTALGTLDVKGREKGILAGANVIMPNLTPKQFREKYMIYDGKAQIHDQADQYLKDLKNNLALIGANISMERGDHPDFLS